VTPDPDQILSEFVDAWNAGRRPDVDDYLARAPDDRRDELASMISTFLAVAPTPDYEEQAWEEIRSDPLLQRLAVPELPTLLGRLRTRARLSMSQLAVALSPDLGITGREDKAARYLEQLEAGELDPSGVSSRVFDALGRALRVPAAELLAAARPLPPARPSAAFFRAGAAAQEEVGQHLEVLAEAMAAPAPAGAGWDDVDELFRGGR
jgi:hypothetical protein